MNHNNNNEPVLFPILNHIQNDLWQLHSLCYPTLCKFYEAWFQNKAIFNQQLTLTYFDKIFFSTYSIEIKFAHHEKENCTRFKVNLHSIVAWKSRNSSKQARYLKPNWLNDWVFVFELSVCGFESHISHLRKIVTKKGETFCPVGNRYR